MWADTIVELDSAGHRVWEWHACQHLDFDLDVIHPNFTRHEWLHGNALAVDDAGHVMVSFRATSTIAIIDKTTGEIVWRVGPPTVYQQHDPNLLPNGNILVFSNGLYRPRDVVPSSSVVEIDRRTKQVVWEYVDNPPSDFSSPSSSSPRRLPNGNTLVTEGMFGRIFQVTPEKQVVWEYVSPYYARTPTGTETNEVFRAIPYAPEEADKWLADDPF